MTGFIQFWPADTGACGRYRCEYPGYALADAGFEVRVDRQLDLHRLCDTDVVVGQRLHMHRPSHLWQQLARDDKRTGRLVYELDDDVWALQHEHHNPAALEWGPHLGLVQQNLACADAVTVSTDTLADVVSQFTSAPVHVVPNAVPDYLLDWAQVPGASTDDGGRLGWGGSSTHDGDWEHDQVARAVVRWADRSGFPLRFLGHTPEPVARAIANTRLGSTLRTDALGWTANWVVYYNRIAAFWVGLAPLAPTPFNRSKSDLRLLEYAALGVPWLASDSGPYAAAEHPFRGGLSLRRASEWGTALDSLVEDARLYGALVAQGRAWAKTRTVSAVLPKWREALGL